jgi:hypothetical protein
MQKVYWLIAAAALWLPSVMQAATATSISQNGITWTFSQACEVGQFVNGEYWVQAPVTIQSVSPAWDDTMHGSMLEPEVGPYQGYCTAAAGFRDSLRARFPLTVTAGIKSLISTVGKVKTSGGAAEAIKAAAVLTIVDTPPAAGSFRPPYVAGDKPFFNTAQIQNGLLPRLAKPTGTLPGTTMMRYLWLDHSSLKVSGATMHPTDNMPAYPPSMGCQVSQMALMVLLDIPQRDTLLYRFLQLGIDNYYCSIENGDAWRAYAGFGTSRKWPILFAGIMFNDTAMQHPPKYIGTGSTIDKFGEDGQTFYGQPTIEFPQGKALWGQDCVASGWPNQYTTYCAGDTEDENISGDKDCRDPAGIKDGCTGYRICCTSYTWVGAALAAMLMHAQPVWDHNAHFDYVDRWVSEPASWSNSSTAYYRDVYGYGGTGSGFMANMWATYRSTVSPIHRPTAPVPAKENWQLNVLPNPWNGAGKAMVVEYQLDSRQPMELSIYTTDGNRVAELVRGEQEQGYHRSWWSGHNAQGKNINNGIYYVKLKAGNENIIRSITVINR